MNVTKALFMLSVLFLALGVFSATAEAIGPGVGANQLYWYKSSFVGNGVQAFDQQFYAQRYGAANFGRNHPAYLEPRYGRHLFNNQRSVAVYNSMYNNIPVSRGLINYNAIDGRKFDARLGINPTYNRIGRDFLDQRNRARIYSQPRVMDYGAVDKVKSIVTPVPQPVPVPTDAPGHARYFSSDSAKSP